MTFASTVPDSVYRLCVTDIHTCALDMFRLVYRHVCPSALLSSLSATRNSPAIQLNIMTNAELCNVTKFITVGIHRHFTRSLIYNILHTCLQSFISYGQHIQSKTEMTCNHVVSGSVQQMSYTTCMKYYYHTKLQNTIWTFKFWHVILWHCSTYQRIKSSGMLCQCCWVKNSTHPNHTVIPENLKSFQSSLTARKTCNKSNFKNWHFFSI